MANGQFVKLGPIDESIGGGWKLYHYAAGTTTLKNVYIDRAQSTTAAQPVVADARGHMSFYASGLYRLDIYDQNDVLLYSYDNVFFGDTSSVIHNESASSVTSASTLVLPEDGDYVHVTGTNTVSALSGTQPFVLLTFDSACPLTNGASFRLFENASRTTQAGETLLFVNDGSNVWREVAPGLIRLAADLTWTGAHTFSGAITASSTVTVSGTADVTGTLRVPRKADPGSPATGEVWINSSGTVLEYRDNGGSPASHEVVGHDTTQTLTNKTINLANNTLTGTTAEFNTALSDGDFATLAGSETLTNKTLTSPTITGNTVGTGAIKTATGSSSIGSVVADVALNDYSFFPSFAGASGGSTLQTYNAGGDPGDTVGRVRVNAAGIENVVVRWRYITASDEPTIWIAVDGAGNIAAAWASDDPPPGDVPGVEVPGCTSVKQTAADLSGLSIPQSALNAADAKIAARRLKTRHRLYRALQEVAQDEAPSRWLLENCRMVNGRLQRK